MPQTFARDPNALQTLLKMQPQSYGPTSDEENYGPMVSEQDVYDTQAHAGDDRASANAPYFVPSRDSIKQSKYAELKALFGQIEAKGNANSRPAQVKGAYDVESARVKSAGDVEATRQKAVAEATQRTSQNEFLTGQQSRQQSFQGEQGDLNRSSQAENGRLNRENQMAVARETTGRAASTQAAITSRQNPSHWWDRFLPSGGGGAAASTPTRDLAPYKSDPEYANLPFEALVQQGIVSGTPEELAAYQQEWEQQ